MEAIKVKLIVDVPEPAWCHGHKGETFEVFDDGECYELADGSHGYLNYNQVEVLAPTDK